MTVTGDHVKKSIPLLQDAPGLEVGLHLVFSGGEPPLTAAAGLIGRDGRFLPLSKLALRAWIGRLEKEPILAEIAQQAEMFQRLMGRPPAYVDSHHHAHQLPIIRDALIDGIHGGLLPSITRMTLEPPEIWRVPSGSAVRFRRWVARRLGLHATPVIHRRPTACERILFRDAIEGGSAKSFSVGYLFPELASGRRRRVGCPSRPSRRHACGSGYLYGGACPRTRRPHLRQLANDVGYPRLEAYGQGRRARLVRVLSASPLRLAAPHPSSAHAPAEASVRSQWPSPLPTAERRAATAPLPYWPPALRETNRQNQSY